MMRSLAILVVLMPATGSLAQTAPTALSCSGPFAKDASEAGLIAAFGKANVTREDIDVGEGSTEPGTVVFAKDEKRRLEILWHDNAKRRRPATVMARGEGSTWRLADHPIGVGSGLAEVEAANGKAFTVLGFGWDQGGYAGDWKGGALAKIAGGCSLALRFGPDPKANGKALDRVSGDKEFTSAQPGMRAVKPRVEQISIGWAE